MGSDRPATQGATGAPSPEGDHRGHPDGTKVLVLGILGLVLCQILAPFAWVMGTRVVEEIDSSPNAYDNRGTANIGRICGIVGTIIGVLGVIAAIVALIASASSSIESWFEYMSDERDDLWQLTIEHALLVVEAMAVAVVVAIVVGIVVQTRPTARNIALSITSVFLTIPSLALFTLFIPLLGIGRRPVLVALFMYALLPILRNTVTGLDSVDPAVEESAKGMGMNATRRLFQVKLPLAWPVIVAGIRVATLLTTGIAAIGTLVSGGGLGDAIKDGFNRLGLPNSYEPLWAGTILVVVLALVFDLLLALTTRLLSPSIIASIAEAPDRLLAGRKHPSSDQEPSNA